MEVGRRQNNLLVVDDDPAFCRVFRKAAEALGYEVSELSDPRHLQRSLHAQHPSVVVLDLRMPGTDGIELLRDLAADQCRATVFVSSGLDGKTVEAAVRLGTERGLKMGGVLHKPISLEQLRNSLPALGSTGEECLVSEIDRALQSGQMFLEYQPKVDCRLGRVSGVEALVRWQHPQRGLVRPDQFIPAAEQTDAIDRLTDWVMREATRQSAVWRSAGVPLDVAINVSARNLVDRALPDRLARISGEAGIDADSITLEVTETAAMHDPIQTMDVLTRLRIKGFRLSIDDFGTGYSSLIRLRKMPLSEMKVDRSFIMHMMQDRDCEIIVEMVIDLARKLGLRSVAEGVEDEATLDRLRAMGCDNVQGYFLSRPVAADRIPEFVRTSAAKSVRVDA